MKKIRLNLGCGHDIRKEYINVDSVKLNGTNKVHDLNKFPYPFANNSVDEVLVRHVLEHLVDYHKALKEILRILRPGGKVKIIVPYFNSVFAFSDPTHKHFFGYKTFDYFLKDNGMNYYFDFGFSEMKNKRLVFGKGLLILNHLIEPFANMFPKVYENTTLRSFPASELQVELIK